MKRQRGRNRGGNGGQGGGKPQQHNVNRSFESGGPDNVKIRGNAQHVYEKYQQLARDASSSGDRVLAENYLQHAEHYFRVIRAVQPNKPLTDIIGRDTFSGYDIDFEDESGAQAYAAEGTAESEAAPAETGDQGDQGQPQRQDQRQDRGEWQPRDRQQNGQPRDRDYNRDDRPREYNRDDRPRDQQRDQQRDGQQQDRYRDDRPRDGQQQRDDRPRDNNQQGDRPPRRDRFGRDRNYNRDDRSRDPMAVVEPEATPLTQVSEAPAPAPTPAPAPEERQLRSQDGSLSPAPAFLQAAAPRAVDTEDGEVRKPRRRRAPKTFEGGDEAPAAPQTEEA
jgi:hypothetical protein